MGELSIKKKILYLVSEDWYFISHRLPMARAARDAGFEVHVGTRVAYGRAAIEAEGFQLHSLIWRRGATAPFAFIAAIAAVRRVYRTVRPDLVHLVALWPCVVGSFAAIGLPMKRLSALTGLGFAFTSNALKARVVRALLRPVLRHLFAGRRGSVLVQNADDRALMERFGIDGSRLFLIPGSGVDTDRFHPLSEPEGPITVGFAGRLLDDKGIRTLVKAQSLLPAPGVRLLIAGEVDPANPGSVPLDEVVRWRSLPGIEVLGHVSDIGSLWAKAHIAVLPSRREGLPKSLLEAAACGRPLIATDVTGCRQVARDGENALLVPVDDPRALARAIEQLANDAGLRARFGAASRALAEREFATGAIGGQTVALYRKLLAQGSGAA